MWVLTSIAAAAAPEALFPAWPGEGEDHTSIALVVSKEELATLLTRRGSEGSEVNSDGGPYTRWILQAETAGGVTVGSVWAMLGAGTRTECTVESLRMVTAGGSDRKLDDLDEFTDYGAPCSTPLVYAQTNCAGVTADIVVPATNHTAVVAERVSTPESPVFDGLEGIDPIREAIRAAAGGRRVRGDVNQSVYRLGAQSVTVTLGRFYTGEGETHCGGEDLATDWFGVQGAGHVGVVRDGGLGHIRAVVDLQGDGKAEVIEDGGGRSLLRDADGNVLLQHDIEWCVCGC